MRTTDFPARQRDVERDGFTIVPKAIASPVTLARLVTDGAELASDENGDARRKSGRVYAVRNLMSAVPTIGELARSTEVRSLVEPYLGADAFPVRAIWFDKTAGANWKVAWHQDLSIAVRERIDVPGFGPWSVKAGVQHVQPPVEVLRGMLTVRVHLDDCDTDNGPLLVLPGSHADGVLSPAALAQWRERVAPFACLVPAGGAVLMRPLTLHASSAAVVPRHRRVIHIEYAAVDLPGGLEWAERLRT